MDPYPYETRRRASGPGLAGTVGGLWRLAQRGGGVSHFWSNVAKRGYFLEEGTPGGSYIECFTEEGDRRVHRHDVRDVQEGLLLLAKELILNSLVIRRRELF